MKEKRIDIIMKEIEKHGIVSVNDLMKKLGVTRMTIGRDLKLLEDSNMLKRIHGGAVRNEDSKLTELTHLQKKNINISKKEEFKKHFLRFKKYIIENPNQDLNSLARIAKKRKPKRYE
mgnify:CR=1 FL=1